MDEAIKYAEEQMLPFQNYQFTYEDVRAMLILAYMDGMDAKSDKEFTKVV